MKRTLGVLIWISVFVLPAHAQQANLLDYQARFLFHVQHAEKGKQVGFVGWAILPDVTQTKPLRGLFLGGIVYKEKSRWVEIMGGSFVDTNGRVDPLFNLRVSERSLSRAKFFGEAQYVFRVRRLLLSVNATTPANVRRFRFEIGGEMDAVRTPRGWTTGFGPRVIVPLPICKRVCKNASFTVAYQRSFTNPLPNRRIHIVRSYLLFNF